MKKDADFKTPFIVTILNSLKDVQFKSKAEKRKVGAIIVTKSFLYHGYNRTFDNSPCENKNNETFEHVIHAEEDAVMTWLKGKPTLHIADYNNFSEKPVMFCTYSPCINCARLIVNAGITHLIYIDKHKVNFDFTCNVDGDLTVLDFLTKQKVLVTRIDWEGNVIETNY
ncbi:deaminase [Candidatus Dojkabacteria bacterium]|jgi:deoxycytidylate deaminase|nr:deaminase [Candidatus Dojkabacteria bacterium]